MSVETKTQFEIGATVKAAVGLGVIQQLIGEDRALVKFIAPTAEGDSEDIVLLEDLQLVDVQTPTSARISKSPMQVAAEDALDRHLYVFALGEGVKEPDSVESPNGFRSSTNDREKVNGIWTRKPKANIGIDCGQSDLCVFDFDRKEDIPAWVEQYKTTKVQTARGIHVYTRGARPSKKMYDATGKHIGEIKSLGGYVIWNQSVHPSGAIYQIIDDGPIAPVPDDRYAELVKHAPSSQGSALQEGQKYPHGQIHNVMVSQARKLLSADFRGDKLVNELLEWVHENCEAPIDEAKVIACAKSIDSLYGEEAAKTKNDYATIGGVIADASVSSEPKKIDSNKTMVWTRRAKTTRASDIKMKALDWVWNQRLLNGALNSISGDPGIGKGLISADIVACVTTGRDFPDGMKNLKPPMDVLIISDEEAWDQAIVPRLAYAGTDLTRVHRFQVEITCEHDNGERTIMDGQAQLNKDLPDIEEKTKEFPEIGLIIIDPAANYFGDDVDNCSDKDVRPVLMPLHALMERLGICGLLIYHWNKNRNASAGDRTGGAKSLITIPRCNHNVLKDPLNPKVRLFNPHKCNYSDAFLTTMMYHTAGHKMNIAAPGEPELIVDTAYVVWEGQEYRDPDELIRQQSESDPGNRKGDTIKSELKRILADGALPATVCYEALQKLGFESDQVKRVRRDAAKYGQFPNEYGRVTHYWGLTQEALDKKRQQCILAALNPLTIDGQVVTVTDVVAPGGLMRDYTPGVISGDKWSLEGEEYDEYDEGEETPTKPAAPVVPPLNAPAATPDDDTDGDGDIIRFIRLIVGASGAIIPTDAIKAVAEARGLNWKTVVQVRYRHGDEFESIKENSVTFWRRLGKDETDAKQ